MSIDKLKIIKHENSVPIFELFGHLTEKTILTLVINASQEPKYILDCKHLEYMDDRASKSLVMLALRSKVTLWNASEDIKKSLSKHTMDIEMKP